MRRFFQRRAPRVVDALICSAALLCQIAILAFARCGASAYAILMAHAAVVAGLFCCLLARHRLRGDGTVLTIALVATASTGPIGAIACAVVAWLRVLANPYRFAHRRWLLRAAGAGTDDPASLLTARIRSGRSIDPSAPVPSPLESALTGGRPADRAAAFYRLSTRYDPELASVLNAALTSATLPVRTPAYAILASLIESALARHARLVALLEKRAEMLAPEGPKEPEDRYAALLSRCHSSEAEGLIHQVFGELAHWRRISSGKRVRQFRSKRGQAYHEAIERFVGDLLRARADNSASGLIFHALGKTSFDDDPVNYDVFAGVLKGLKALELVGHEMGRTRFRKVPEWGVSATLPGRASRFWATAKLIEFAEHRGIRLDNIGDHFQPEPPHNPLVLRDYR